MQLQESLTKENFWNMIMNQFPYATTQFCIWIDEYKKVVRWNELFGEKIKFHDLPYAMQQGVWLEFVRSELSKYFEQPEHIAESFDLEEDIKEVFNEIETLEKECQS